MSFTFPFQNQKKQKRMKKAQIYKRTNWLLSPLLNCETVTKLLTESRLLVMKFNTYFQMLKNVFKEPIDAVLMLHA